MPALGSPLNQLGIYNQLGAAHLWSAWSTLGASTIDSWKALIGSVNLVPSTTPTMPRSGLSNNATIKYQAGLVCPAANSGYYGAIGAIGTDHTVVLAGISLPNNSGDSYYYIITSGGPGLSAPYASGAIRGTSVSNAFSVSQAGYGGTINTASLGQTAVPFVAIVTQSMTEITLRFKALTKQTQAWSMQSSGQNAWNMHIHGYGSTSGQADRMQGDTLSELAVFRRVLSDADAVTLMQNRCAAFGITPASWEDAFSLAGLPPEHIELALEFLDIALLLLAEPLSDAREQALHDLLAARAAALALIPPP